jgi:hypothetical protein
MLGLYIHRPQRLDLGSTSCIPPPSGIWSLRSFRDAYARTRHPLISSTCNSDSYLFSSSGHLDLSRIRGSAWLIASNQVYLQLPRPSRDIVKPIYLFFDPVLLCSWMEDHRTGVTRGQGFSASTILFLLPLCPQLRIEKSWKTERDA